MHKELVLSAGYDDVVRTLIFSGRPMSVRKTPYVAEWSVFALFFFFVCFFPGFFFVVIFPVICRKADIGLVYYREDRRSAEIKELCAQGKIPHDVEMQSHPEKSAQGRSCKPHAVFQILMQIY